MAEWLGKPRISEEDIRKVQPSLAKYFPVLTRYFVDDQKMRVTVVLPHEKADEFRAAVTKAFGYFGPTSINQAATRALDEWIAKNR